MAKMTAVVCAADDKIVYCQNPVGAIRVYQSTASENQMRKLTETLP